MIALVILACLTGQPDRCSTYQVPLEATLGQCRNVAAMQELPRFAAEHPNLTIRRFSCEAGDRA